MTRTLEQESPPQRTTATNLDLGSKQKVADNFFNRHLTTWGADGYCYWSANAVRELHPRFVHGDPSRHICEASADLAARTLTNGEQKSILLSAPQPYLIVSAPITDSDGQTCITVSFQCELDELCQDISDARLSIVKRFGDTVSNEVDADSSNVAETLFDSLSTSEIEYLSWPELYKQLLGKVALAVDWRRRRVKMSFLTLLVVVFLGFIPFPYRVDCQVVCEPVLRRYVAAPFDARLVESDVVAGQLVAKGQRLAMLDGSELRSQLAGLRAEFAQAQQRLLAALSVGDHSKAEFERLETEHMTREIALLEDRQRRLEITSPIDGIVIAGDLERSQGAPLSTGDSLFEIASLGRFFAEIAVAESEVLHVKDGMQVTIKLDATPGENQFSAIEHIHLRNEIRDNQSVYIAEAELKNVGDKIRPGMSGTAIVHSGHRALGWILFHRPFNAIRHWLGW